jgi:hypothetical protein
VGDSGSRPTGVSSRVGVTSVRSVSAGGGVGAVSGAGRSGGVVVMRASESVRTG